ncbi:MAG: hypothetical protein Rubg2KO_10530 [Rubricoccaceae bacterium]
MASAQKPDAPARSTAIETFRSAHTNGLEVQVDSLTTTVSALVGGRFPGFAGPPEASARAFLTTNQDIFGLSDASQDLGHLSTRQTEGGTQVLFHQRHRGVPILHSGYLVAIDNSGAIIFVSGDAYPDVDINVVPSLNAAAALEMARTDAGAAGAEADRGPELVIWADESGREVSYRLVYSIDLVIKEPRDAWSYLIDAHTGGVLQKTSLVMDANHRPAGTPSDAGIVTFGADLSSATVPVSFSILL